MNFSLKKRDQRGQIMVGFYVGIMAMMGLAIIVLGYITRVRADAAMRENRDLALGVARAGFDEALSYFRTQPDGVYLPINIRPPDQMEHSVTWTAYVWPSWPDDAFRPGPSDTDIYIPVTTYSGTICAAAIIRDIPLHVSRSTTTGSELTSGQLWGRFVVKRQVVRNWGPGSNTLNSFTDPEATHDITDSRDFTNSAALGTGNYWSITSRGYVYFGNSSAVMGAGGVANDDISAAASTVYNCLTSSPLAVYKNRPLLLSTAKIYGEFFRANFSSPDAAVFVSAGNNVTGNSLGVINGTTDAAIARNLTSNASGATLAGAINYANAGYSPSVSSVFPGLDKPKLQALANYVGDVGIFPNDTAVNFVDATSQTSFYYLKNASSPSTTFLFTQAMHNRFQGTGLVFVDGSLSFTAGTVTGWNGVVFVDGNVYLNEGSAIYGELISTGNVDIRGTIAKGHVDFNSSVKDLTQKLIQGFRVDKPSIVTSYN